MIIYLNIHKIDQNPVEILHNLWAIFLVYEAIDKFLEICAIDKIGQICQKRLRLKM